jgi:hypothetical protein
MNLSSVHTKEAFMIERHLPSGRFLVLFVATVLLLTFGPSLSAGSKRPNPAALQKAAAGVAEEQVAAQRQVDSLLKKLASDAEFAKSFDAATYKADRKALTKLIAAGGVSNKFTIDSIDKDLRIRITIRCGGGGCSISITISW